MSSQTLSHPNTETGNTSTGLWDKQWEWNKVKFNKRERVRAKQELQCGGRAIFMGFREECEVSNSSLVFC